MIDDPTVFAGPRQITPIFRFMPDHNRVDDFFCENNPDGSTLFRKHRAGRSGMTDPTHMLVLLATSYRLPAIL